MRISLIIANHNEGDSLSKTIESCIETCVGLDYEIIVADDASTDRSADLAFRAFPQISLYRHDERRGASPTKALGARHAHGEVLVFIDAHCKPEFNSIASLVADVEGLNGEAIVTPALAALDSKSWNNDLSQIGNGYWMDLLNFDCGWRSLSEMKVHRFDGKRYYESPALIGAAFAVSRYLYQTVWGLDVNMQYWGVEDLDFGFKSWQLGYSILHDPDVVVGHSFRTEFNNYSVPLEHVLANQLRMARKSYTHGVWAEWLDRCRQRNQLSLEKHPEGMWAYAWQIFNSQLPSVEKERSYIQARRVRDEFAFAEAFDLGWPRLGAKGATPSVFFAANPSPSPKPSPGPSPSPPPGCRFQITGPSNVPGLSQYQYQINLPAGQTAFNILWSVNKSTASIVGPNNQPTAIIRFNNSTADWIQIKATFNLNGRPECAQKQVALVKVDLGTATFSNPGKPSFSADPQFIFLVNPPAPPATPTWITSHVPGSACGAFTYNGTNQAREPSRLVSSAGGGGGAAFVASTQVTLTSPPQKPTAHQKIQIGFIQGASENGSAIYATTPPGGRRIINIPTINTVDWLGSPCSPTPNDDWPWYDITARATGSGSGSWSTTLSMNDSPTFAFPAQLDPNHGKTDLISSGTDTFAFVIRIAARTLDSDLGANNLYFEEGRSNWEVDFAWPVISGVSIVATGPDWAKASLPTEVAVNIVPTVTNHNAPFLRIIP